MMVQGAEEEFGTCYSNVHSWIQMIQKRLQATDNIEGSKEALEARLKETEEILTKEAEGRRWLQMVQAKADLILRDKSDDKKHEIHRAMKQIKTMWEDTQTNMVHCHSRIEWVLLHWSEYLKAREDYFSWLINIKQKLDSDLELQLALKEKKLQLNHYEIILSSILNQTPLLERLLQESGSLFAKTVDETLNEEAQQKLKTDHEELELKAKQKVTILEEIVQEHQLYLENCEKFANWLQLMKEKNNCCNMHKKNQDHVDGSLQELRELRDAVMGKEGDLDNLQTRAQAVMQNTSPKGAEDIMRDLDKLRTDWENLRVKCEQDQSTLELQQESTQESQSRVQQLERQVVELLDRLQFLDLEPSAENEPEMMWHECLSSRSSVLEEESRVEELQMKLKDLDRFFQNENLSAKVLNAVQECKRVKSNIMKRCSRLGENLRQGFQKLLKEFDQWRHSARNLLNSLHDETMTRPDLQHIENHLTRSKELQVQLGRLQALEGVTRSIFNSEQTAAFGAELREATWQREFLTHLLMRKKEQIQMRKHDGVNRKFLMKKFETWLKTEDQKLTHILDAKNPLSNNRKESLKKLNCAVPHGQKIFEKLMDIKYAIVNEEKKKLEDLRYRWVLYKTKLRDAAYLQIQAEDAVEVEKCTSRGICHYLSRVCWAALPLQLILLLLLLLAFLLPLTEEQGSCSVVNNLARSFSLMLRYQGPPPT
ncbi:nesprin-3 isoform X2 [Narcine bancroftii]|uniref:nesprin-3 isoform X2 n=1 Tax=Narcine bancroftii TaxID=1343680 RepID=UPI003831C17F